MEIDDASWPIILEVLRQIDNSLSSFILRHDSRLPPSCFAS